MQIDCLHGEVNDTYIIIFVQIRRIAAYMTRTSQLLQDHSRYKATGILVRS